MCRGLSDHRPGRGRRRAARCHHRGHDVLRGADGTAAARAWAGACVASGECIKACDYGVNPRFLLAMTRVEIARKDEIAVRRRKGSRASGALPATSTISRGCSSRTNCWNGSASARGPTPRSRRRSPISCSTLAATCSRPRTSRCSRSMSWTRSASPIGCWAVQPIAAACSSCALATPKPSAGSRKRRSTSSQQATPARCSPGARAARCSSPKSRCRRSSACAAHGRSR